MVPGYRAGLNESAAKGVGDMPSEKNIREALARWQQELNQVASEIGRVLQDVERLLADDADDAPYGCKCSTDPALVEGRHLGSCPHYSDEGDTPGFRAGNTDPEQRGRGDYPEPRN